MQLPVAINTADYEDVTSNSILADAVYRFKVTSSDFKAKDFGGTLGIRCTVSGGIHSGKSISLYFNYVHNNSEKSESMARGQISSIIRAATGSDKSLTATEQLLNLVFDGHVAPETMPNGKLTMKFKGAEAPEGEAPDNQPAYEEKTNLPQPTQQTLAEVEPSAPVGGAPAPAW